MANPRKVMLTMRIPRIATPRRMSTASMRSWGRRGPIAGCDARVGGTRALYGSMRTPGVVKRASSTGGDRPSTRYASRSGPPWTLIEPPSGSRWDGEVDWDSRFHEVDWHHAICPTEEIITQDPDHCGAEWRGQDDIRRRVPATRSRMPGVHQCRPDCPRPFALRPGAGGLRGRKDHVDPDGSPRERPSKFAFETTLSGIAYARRIPRWRNSGYHVKLIFLNLP